MIITEIEASDYEGVEFRGVNSDGISYFLVPDPFKEIFHNSHVTRINGVLEFPRLPNRSLHPNSIPPHYDNDPSRNRNNLALTCRIANRGAQTFVTTNRTFEHFLSESANFLREFYGRILEEFLYDTDLVISERELRDFLNSGGERYRSFGDKLYSYTSHLAFCLRGSVADDYVKRFIEWAQENGEIYIENWEKPGTLIINNKLGPHGRYGSGEHLLELGFGQSY